MFINNEEKNLSEEFIKNGFIKKKIEDTDSLDSIKSKLIKIVNSYKELKAIDNLNLENIHDHISVEILNDFRLHCINEISKIDQ